MKGRAAVTADLAFAVFAIVRTPETGWGSAQTLLQLTGAAVLLAVCNRSFHLVSRR
ncbi:hypothetical protein [Streptomyces indiaensis]|uniref:Uncharacterized protein n=1 Tax=Streptomyces indiaensis TaxID=284033 RepID=A0ABN3DFL0_9ACTN|nr:hypothetical protein [Streptomyces indiaensis]